jgi:hypothetical protein
MRENDFECFASTGVNSPANAIFEHTDARYYLHITARCTPSCPASSVAR